MATGPARHAAAGSAPGCGVVSTASHPATLTICHIGAFHGTTGRTVTNADSLADRLASVGVVSICASRQVAALRRGASMLGTIFSKRSSYRVVLIHVYSGKAFLWAACSTLLAKALGKRVVLWLHGGNLPVFSARYPGLVRRVFGSADRLLAPTGYLARSAGDQHQVDIVPYELPIDAYPFHERRSVRPRMLWVRAFSQLYNAAMAPRVVQLLAEQLPDVTLTMCGPDNGDGSFQETQRVAHELGVADRLELPGKVSKERIKQLGQECDIFLNTTTVDNTPVSVVEAMAMGMCVISTNVGGMPYLVTDELDGLLVTSNDPGAMAQACRRVLDDPALAHHLSTNARRRALDFDWQRIAPRWSALLQELSG